ncbi:peptidylprolyl isomerase [Thalassococcus profundi]|uniref:Peptidylprolyl isomerase n=1 Tax=Thalassococcus profundi TaxID=2282382 RepID=A0A369TR22_9RHOB|nr:peptidylprolyl isomerase [Thalassococcus profundi]RDD66885.1 peptidylprolyl isomerase [Thalassococcus profundi]
MAFKARSLSKTFVWILMGLLILGLAGFGATNLSGTLRSIGTVGDRSIGVDRYARTLQNEIRAQQAETGNPLTVSQAVAQGLDQRALAQLVTAAALDEEAERMGLSIGDAELARQVQQIGAFQGPDGSFDREAYRFALQNNGLSESEFEEDLRGESARTLLQGAVLAGNTLPETYVNTILAYAGEERSFTWSILGEGALDTGVPEPTEADLQTYYDENIDAYTRPETRAITYAWLTPEMIVDTVEVDEEALREAYEARAAEFNLPERRLVERLVFSDEAAAQEALDRIESGDATFETTVAVRGLSLADVDMGDVTQPALGAAGEPVFAAETGAVVGPLPSDLGPALYRVNGVLAAQTTPFEEAEPQLRNTLALDRARRVIETQAQGFDDLMAGGATLEDLAEETEMDLGQIDWTGGSEDGIAAYEAFREAAAAATPEDFPDVEELGDGGVFALRVDEVRPPAPAPLDEVRDRVRQGWETAQKTAALEEQAQGLVQQLGDGQTFEALGLEPRSDENLTRTANIQDLPPGLLPAVFDIAAEGEAAVVPLMGSVALVRLDAITPADPEAEGNAQLAQLLRDQAAGDLANDLFRALSADIQSRVGVSIDQSARNAVHTQLQ